MRDKVIILGTSEKTDKILRKPTRKVKNFQDPEIIVLKQVMESISMQDGSAGVAANQLGYSYSIFCLNIARTKLPFKSPKATALFFNPRIMSISEEADEQIEGCLSIPGRVGMVTRGLMVTLDWYNEKGMHYNMDFQGYSARAIQHEMGHIEGLLYTDVCKDTFDEHDLENAYRKQANAQNPDRENQTSSGIILPEQKAIIT